MSAPLLALQGLTRRFGGLTAVDQVSAEVSRGELVGLIGNYTIVAMMLNTFQIGVPEGEKRPFTRS